MEGYVKPLTRNAAWISIIDTLSFFVLNVLVGNCSYIYFFVNISSF